ncbi:beta-mannosidase [Lederbergia ruris]|uniref:Beta-mannosidase B n=1 Tax=Lederbergia ruris TaxID=217495 RepID=A0ABQ4KIC6_9BACI|nr:glycoside hydrolase family 2 protein [Lederbergia ruris]GIN57236.1 beta-mannosidase [Lederbergia ruris]
MKYSMFLAENWRFRQSGEDNWLQAKVPGCVHTDLWENRKIEDPFYGKNELDLQWIDKQDWEYETTFDLTEELFQQKNLEIVFEGLDTYADVYFNGNKILSADNMFRTWKADIKPYAKKEENRLLVSFRSPVKEDLPKLESLGYGLPASNDHSEDGGLGEKRISIFARKAPYHYGWDWGPRFVTSGIWKPVQIYGWSEVQITDLYIQQNVVTTQTAQLTAKVEIEADQEWEGKLQLATEGLNLEKEVSIQKGNHTIELEFELENPKLWWCRGLGEPNLYQFLISFSKAGKTVAEKKVRTGLRTIRLVKEKDEVGKSFYFELNGVPVFAKGANHIPNDSFLTNITYEHYRHEIASAAESNMNMLRVWGGGIYEYDTFYELCDEYGIMVWQDFMFACSMYPGDQAFLDNVKREAEENVKRLRNHPSLALWCGNNEMDSAWAHYIEHIGWGWKQEYTQEIREKIWADYEEIFHHILPKVVQDHAPEIDYWPSSPMSELTGDEHQHTTYTSTSGDMHYWDVWHGAKPLEDYKKVVGRFMSEYGFQSFPELKTVQTYAEETELELESPVMLHHQKNGRGNQLIKEYMDQYYQEPKDFPAFLYMSHILQADAIKTAIEAHRAQKPYCMGTLYWQMNDCWPVASWSSMDYYGRWKAVQYTAKRSYRDVIVLLDQVDEELNLMIVSDRLQDIDGSLQMTLYDFSGEKLWTYDQEIQVKSNTVTMVDKLAVKDILQNHEANKVVLQASLETKGQTIDQKEHYFVKTKDIDLEVPLILIEQVKDQDHAFVLTTNVLAKNVWLDAEKEGIFSDNYFDLIPGISKKITFSARDNGQSAFVLENPGAITVQSMAGFVKKVPNRNG